MHSLPQEFLALCRQLGEAQKRCSAAMAAQAAQVDALSAEVVRLRAAVVIRDTRLAWARQELEQLRAEQPGLQRRRSMARHITMLAERITALSRECLRWKLAAAAPQRPLAPAPTSQMQEEVATDAALSVSLAAADWVICQTGCISHDQYWRVQDHCRRTGTACILVDQPLAARQMQPLPTVRPVVVLQKTPSTGNLRKTQSSACQ